MNLTSKLDIQALKNELHHQFYALFDKYKLFITLDEIQNFEGIQSSRKQAQKEKKLSSKLKEQVLKSLSQHKEPSPSPGAEAKPEPENRTAVKGVLPPESSYLMSVTHSRGLVVLVASSALPGSQDPSNRGTDDPAEEGKLPDGIGIDIEFLDRQIRRPERLKRRLLTQPEQQLGLSLLEAWTLKEACFKADPETDRKPEPEHEQEAPLETRLLTHYVITQWNFQHKIGRAVLKASARSAKKDFGGQQGGTVDAPADEKDDSGTMVFELRLAHAQGACVAIAVAKNSSPCLRQDEFKS